MENERYNQHRLWNSESEILDFSDDIPYNTKFCV